MKISSNVIIYFAGGYGTFLEWLCYHCSGDLKSPELPFTKTGSSHKYHGHLLGPRNREYYLTTAHNHKFIRCHENFATSLFDSIDDVVTLGRTKCVKVTIDRFLEATTGKILYVCPTNDSKLWIEHNAFEKVVVHDGDLSDDNFVSDNSHMGKAALAVGAIDKIKIFLDNELSLANIKQWGKHHSGDLDLWELRELASLYWFDRVKTNELPVTEIRSQYPQIKLLPVNQLRDNPLAAIGEVLDFFDVEFDRSEISNIVESWKAVQYDINKDILCEHIVDCLVNQVSYSWENENIKFLDEAYIQKRLRDHGLEIKCYQLNTFPKNTEDFRNLIESR